MASLCPEYGGEGDIEGTEYVELTDRTAEVFWGLLGVAGAWIGGSA